MKTVLEKHNKNNFSLIVFLSTILLYVEGAVFLYTDLMAPAALFASENICILVILFVTFKINFDERRKKGDGLEKDPNSYSQEKVRHENVSSKLFNELTLYLLIRSKLSFIGGSVLGLTCPLCSL